MTDKKSGKLNRRDLLKLMSAGAGGIAASAFLPAKWTKPVINAGVSPVHAQASITTGTIKGTTYLDHPPFNKPTDPNIQYQWSPLDGCQVSVDGSPALTSTSGLDGTYTITGVPVGSQTISCVPPQQYYTAYNPSPCTGVSVSVNGITDTVQDFQFLDQG